MKTSQTLSTKIIALLALSIILPFAILFVIIYIIERKTKILGPARRFFHEHEKVIGYKSGERILEN